MMGWHGIYASTINLDSLRKKIEALPEDSFTVDELIRDASDITWNDIRAAELYAQHALAMAEKLNYKKGIAYARYRLAIILKDYDYKVTEKYLLESLQIAEAINDSVLLGRIYNSIGNLKGNVGEDKNAESYYNRALDVFKVLGRDSLMAKIYNNLGIIYDNRDKYDSALVYYRKSEAIHKNKNNTLGLAISYLNQGFSSMLAKRADSGYFYLEQSLKLAKDHDYNRLLPYIYNNFSSYFLEKNNYEEAIHFAQIGYDLSTDQINRLQIERSLWHLKEAYFKKQDFKNAYKYAEEINAIKDTINQYKKLKEIDILEMQHALEQEKIEQQFQNELFLAKIRQQKLTVTLIAVGTGLIILVLAFLYFLQYNRMRRKTLEQKSINLEKEKLEQQLEFKNKELTTNVMYLIKKNEFITNISNKLKNADLDDEHQKNMAIDRIIAEMDRSISQDSWADFEVRFQEVHVGFYNRLSKQFPDLTPNELRLCAFLRLNMTSKEIAGITYQSVDSLKTARYRLRKKLGLSRDDNLVAFLTRI